MQTNRTASMHTLTMVSPTTHRVPTAMWYVTTCNMLNSEAQNPAVPSASYPLVSVALPSAAADADADARRHARRR